MLMLVLRPILVFALFTVTSSLRIGTLLVDGKHEYVVSAFQAAVHVVNHRAIASNCSIEQASVIYVESAEPYLLALKLREVADAGISVLVGPPDAEASEVIETLCAELGIVFIKYFWHTKPCTAHHNALNIFPVDEYYNLLVNLIDYWQWERIVLVFAKSSTMCHFHRLLQRRYMRVILLEVDDSSYYGFLRAGKMLRVICDQTNCWRNINRLLIDMSPSDTHRFMQAALMLGMINLRNWYLITSLDTMSDNMEPYSHNMMRIGLATVWDEQHALKVLGEQQRFYYERFVSSWKSIDRNHKHIPYREFAQIFDAVLVACRLQSNIDNRKDKKLADSSEMAPILRSPPFDGVIKEGLTGPIRFDSLNRRVDSKIFVWELGIDGVPINTGIWKSNAALSLRQLSMHDKELPNTHERVLRERKTQRLLKVTSIIERPYVMPKRNVNGIVEYEGFCVDLLDKLAEYLNFEYKLYIVKDGKYGEPINGTAEWSGMIGEILRGSADMAVAPITVTARRLEVVDFTDPFLQLGISMLMRQPDRATSSSLTSFLWPLSGSVWMYSAFATIGTALSVIIVSLLSPAESAHQFNVTNSVWYLVCILLRAGSGYNCESVSNRIISTVWWSFTLVLIAQYTANFAAVLTVDRKSMPFNSFEELGNQTEYTFGSILGGSTMQFFKYSRLETFRRIWTRMQNITPSVFVHSNSEGVQRVLNEKYVFLMESASLEYQLTQNCNLTRVGTVVLGSNGYSIALPKGSRWREKLTRQILDFNEKGIMMVLKSTWWKKTPQMEDCGEPVEERSSLGMEKVSGLFVLLGFGLCISLLVALCEKIFFTITVMRFYQRRQSKHSSNKLRKEEKPERI